MNDIIEKLEDACSLVSAAKHNENKIQCNKILAELHDLLHNIRDSLQDKLEDKYGW